MDTDQETPVTAWRRTYTTLAWLGAGTLAAISGVITMDNLFGVFSDGLGSLGQAIILVLLLIGASLVGGVLSTLGSLQVARTSLKAAGIVATVAMVLLLLAAVF